MISERTYLVTGIGKFLKGSKELPWIRVKDRVRGFTLVEILIVVIILGILAAIVIPQFANASSDARVTNLKTTLANVRNQIEVFKCQHNDTAPALSGMWALMTGQTDTSEANSNAPTGSHWGALPTGRIRSIH